MRDVFADRIFELLLTFITNELLCNQRLSPRNYVG